MASDKRTFDATETEEGKNKKLKTAEKIENNASEVVKKQEPENAFGEKQVEDSGLVVKTEHAFVEKHVQGGGVQIPLAGAELEEVTDSASSPFLHLQSRSFLLWE